MTHLILSYC